MTAEQARQVYDRIERAQDTQSFYEEQVTSRLVELSSFERSRPVFEPGCGIGRFSAGLLRERLLGDARLRGADLSLGMSRESCDG